MAYNPLQEDLKAERYLAQLEGRSFNQRDFQKQYAPHEECSTDNVEDFASWAKTTVRQRVKSAPTPTERDVKVGMRRLLLGFIQAGLGVRRIATQLTALNIPKTGRNKDYAWTAPGVQWLLAAHGLKTVGDRSHAALATWARRKPKPLASKKCVGCDRVYEAKEGKAARRNFRQSSYCSQDCMRRNRHRAIA